MTDREILRELYNRAGVVFKEGEVTAYGVAASYLETRGGPGAANLGYHYVSSTHYFDGAGKLVAVESEEG